MRTDAICLNDYKQGKPGMPNRKRNRISHVIENPSLHKTNLSKMLSYGLCEVVKRDVKIAEKDVTRGTHNQTERHNKK